MDKYLKNKKIDRFKCEIEPQEILLDSLARKKEEEIGVSEKKLEFPLSQKIIQRFLIIFLILIFILFAKTFQLQILDGTTLSLRAEENKLTEHAIRPERGVIYDKKLRQLVFNKPSFDLVYDKRDLSLSSKETIEIFQEVSKIIQKDLNTLVEQIETSNWAQVLISENLDHETLILLETKIDQLAGFQIKKNTIRDYRDGLSFAHLIGYTGKIDPAELKVFEGYHPTDYIGKTGLEKSYERILRGEPGELQIKKDALGRKKGEFIKSPSEDGKSLVLWIDSELQKKIEKELKKMLKSVGSQKAVAVAIDPRSGGVLALVSIPGIDNNHFSHGISLKDFKKILEDPLSPLFHRAISGEYSIGSIIKPLLAVAALEEDLIDPEKQILTQGKIQIPHQYNPDIVYTFRDWRVHGWTDMRKAIADSVNVYFYAIGGGYKDQEGLRPAKIKKYLELFGWGSKTGVGLPDESKGLLPSPAWKKAVKNEGWWDGDTYLLSIGQGDILATPIQVAAAFAAIANNGILYQPQIVQKILDGENNSAQEIRSKIIRKDFINPENLLVVRQGMRQAVTRGTATILNNLPVKAAAKTGTAQTAKQGHFHHWVTVFAPYDDPEIVLTLMIESIEGIRAATLPVAEAVLEWYFTPTLP